jgi:hypothetical protein
MILTRAIRLILDSIGRSDEYEHYLRKFQTDDSPTFAVLAPDLDSLNRMSEAIHFDLQFLRTLDLYPTILLTGPSLPEMLNHFESRESCSILELSGSESIETVGRSVVEVRSRRNIPVVALSRPLPLSISWIVSALSHRLHLIRMSGAIKGAKGDMPYVMAGAKIPIDPADRPIVDLCQGLQSSLPGCHISVTSPINLLREIFTIKGAGTVFRAESSIRYSNTVSLEERDRIVSLLERSFGKKLIGIDFMNEVGHYYIEEKYRAAALLIDTEFGAYLSKFAVGTEARGAGLAQDIWEEMRGRHSSIFWRARRGNSINRWYAVLCDGFHRTERFTIYWKGVDPYRIPGIVDYCLKRSADFEEKSDEQ